MTRLDWTQPVLSVLLALQEQGFHFSSVDDGEDVHCIDHISSATQCGVACELITAVDSAHLKVTNAGFYGGRLWFVLGNEPDEIIANYSYSSDAISESIEAALDAHNQRWEGKPCPTVDDDSSSIS